MARSQASGWPTKSLRPRSLNPMRHSGPVGGHRVLEGDRAVVHRVRGECDWDRFAEQITLTPSEPVGCYPSHMSVQTRRSPGKKNQYVVRWRATGQDRSKSFARMAEARTFDAEIQQSLRSETYVDARAGKITLEEFANDWLDNHTCAPSTKAKYRSLLNAQINPALGALCLDQVTPYKVCLLYTSPSPRDGLLSRMPSSA